MINIFDSEFNGEHSEMYRAEVIPDLFPHAKRMLLENWCVEDLQMFCGGEWAA